VQFLVDQEDGTYGFLEINAASGRASVTEM